MSSTTTFKPGRILATPGAIDTFGKLRLAEFLGRHLSGDWGDLDAEDEAANERALKEGGRLLSAYETEEGKAWIITEADRSATTVLLPSEY